MDKRINRPFATWHLLLTFMVAVACAPATPGSDAPAEGSEAAGTATADPSLPLWELDHEGGTVYLLGSVHLLRPEVYPLDDAIYQAFDEASVVAFELDFDQMMAAAPMMMQRGTFQDGRTLRDVVPEDLYQATVERGESLGLPPQVIESMKPWMAALMLSNLVLQQGGYDAAAGIDLHFHERAKEAEMEIIGLETLDEQIDVFEDLGQEAQAEFLRSTVDQLDDTVEELDRATEYWVSGDTEGLAEMFVESIGEQPALLDALLYERNENWVAQIEELIDGGGTAIVIVGMGHLIGEDSVIELLRSRGYQIRQL